MKSIVFRILLVCAAWLLCVGVFPSHARAEGSACEALKGEQRALADDILKSQHAYDCCDETLAKCLKKKPVCSLVVRLSEDICRRAAKGQSRADIERELSRRATSMMPSGKTFAIDTKATPVAGSADAKVTLSVYLCGRCPFCARLVPALHESVTKGRLSQKAKLVARPFPVRTHPYGTEAGLALMAASQLGKYWEFLLQLYRDFDQFDVAKLSDVGKKVGLDPAKFDEARSSKEVRQALLDAKKEGVRNNVEQTPTVYINGRKYVGELSLEALEDVALEEYERVTGKVKQ